MRTLKRLSKQAKEYLLTTPFTMEDVKSGAVTICRDRDGYSVRLDIIEVEPTKKKKKLFRGCITASDFVSEAIKGIDEGYHKNIVKKALYSALEILQNNNNHERSEDI